MKKLEQITEHIYYFPGEEETDRPFLYYINERDFSVAVDAGQSKENVEEFYAAILEKGFELPKVTLITHWHWDHTFGLPYIQGKSIANELTAKQLEVVSNWEWTKEAMKHREMTGEDIVFCNEKIQIVFPDLSKIQIKNVDQRISENMELDLGDIKVHLYPRDSIHSRDALLIYVPEEKALFVGDADCEDYYSKIHFDQERMKDFRAFVESLDFEHYMLGHDLPLTRKEVIDYFDEIQKQ